MKSYISRAEKINEQIQELAKYSDEKDCLSRIFGTAAFMRCRDTIELWMKEAGLHTSIDNMGNVRGKLSSENTDAKTFVIGSHYDTVIDAGKYDGPLGVLAGLDIMKKLIADQIKPPFNIELIAFSDEEGVRFHTSYLGSTVLTGKFNQDLLEKKDDSGIKLEEVLQQMHYASDQLPNDAMPEDKWLGYYEIHIEQGPVLYKNNVPAGIVTCINGQKRIHIEFNGVSGHAGTVPMNIRKDALAAAAQFVLAVEKLASSKKSNIVATVGKMEVQYAASNVIPGKVSCTLDLRSGNKKKLSRAYEDLNALCEEICNERKVYFEWKLVQESNLIDCDEKLMKFLRKAIKEQDKNVEVIEMESGAGHDAVAISKVAPVAMLFVKCFKGISHNPLENVEIKDIAAALEISDNFMQQLIHSPKWSEPQVQIENKK
ncbi:MAG: M20 family metallo-hydrolase [Bacteroidota bacterium]|nr:M20 family metallo-hydrolase [Bacteroidota bacterium]